MSESSRARVSVLTPSGRGAVAVVAAAGPAAVRAADAHFQAANKRKLADQKPDRINFGLWTSGGHREEVVLLRGKGESLEIHCHGGVAAAGRIVGALIAEGCRELTWPEWLAATSPDPIACEADSALAQATTRRTAAILLDQRNGALAKELSAIRALLNGGDLASARQALVQLLDRAALGLHLSQPWQVAIAGRPNVGKSSLINALVGYQRAIVFDQPGTTRDVLAAETAIDGWPVQLTDAAGIRATHDPLEAEGVARARAQLNRADLVLWVIDATTVRPGDDVLAIAEQELRDSAGEPASGIRPLVVLNKIDLLDRMPITRERVIAVSALSGAGLAELLAAITVRLVPARSAAGQGVPFTARQVESLRAALLQIERGDTAAAAERLTPRVPA